MSAKRIVVALLIIVVAVGGFVAGLMLLRERQDIREEAAVPGGQAEVSLTPESGSYDVGDTISTSVYFNPANIAVSGVAVRLTYPFSGASPEVTVSDITVNSSLLSSGDWTCPTQNSTQQGGNVVVDVACANTSAAGFTTNTNTLLANISFKVNSAPPVSPLIVRFDPALSVITRKTDNQDVLLIPASTGSFTIAGAQVVETPTTAPGVTGAVETETPTPTTKLTATPTTRLTATPTTATAKGGEELPDAGVSYPTIFGVGLGVLMIIFAIVLAI